MTDQSMAELSSLLSRSLLPSEAWRLRARSRLDSLTKPIGSLGQLEEIAAQFVAVRQRDDLLPIRKAVYIFAADHGISAEPVSAYPREVTHQMVLNFLNGGAAINVLAKLHSVDLHIVDVGVDADFEHNSGLHHHKVARGTRNMLREAAMTEEELVQAMKVGGQMADSAFIAGDVLIAVGEMGIGNTTAASAITCALTGVDPSLATGRGTGLDHDSHMRKIAIVKNILLRHRLQPNVGRSSVLGPLDLLRCMGGFEIAAMTGFFLAASSHGLLLIADGFISTAAAALAVALIPNVRSSLIAGHCSEEPGHRILLEHLRLDPLLSLKMRLGEATGAVLSMPIIESALQLYSQMATFSSGNISGASK